MNKKEIIEIKTNMHKILFVSVPYIYKNFKIVQYNRAGTYVMETDGKDLNNWKIKIPRGNYNIIGLSNQLTPELVKSQIKISFNEYIKILNDNDITINYSDNSNFWLVILLIY